MSELALVDHVIKGCATDGGLALVPCVSKNFYRRCEDCTNEASCSASLEDN